MRKYSPRLMRGWPTAWWIFPDYRGLLLYFDRGHWRFSLLRDDRPSRMLARKSYFSDVLQLHNRLSDYRFQTRREALDQLTLAVAELSEDPV